VKLSRTASLLDDGSSRSESNGFISEFSMGILAGLNEKWTAGMLLTQQPLWSRAKIFSAGEKSTESGKALVSRYRTGVGWRPTPSHGLYLDGEYLRVSDKAATMNFARGNLLAEYFPTPVVALRAGAIVDSAAKITYNAAAGYYGFQAVKFDIGYSHNAFAEVRHEFGRMHYFFAIVSTAF
jgi:hypothetical protein